MDIANTHTRPLPQFNCTACSYGASSRIAPERCPMCGGTVWELVETHWVRDLDSPVWRDRPYTDLWRV